jgi:hypothetical protein
LRYPRRRPAARSHQMATPTANEWDFPKQKILTGEVRSARMFLRVPNTSADADDTNSSRFRESLSPVDGSCEDSTAEDFAVRARANRWRPITDAASMPEGR